MELSGPVLRVVVCVLALLNPILAWLLIKLPWEQDVQFGWPGLEDMDDEPWREQGDVDTESRRTLRFPTPIPGGTHSCAGWLYMPDKVTLHAPPVIIMASGLGMARDIGLPTIAQAFAKNGYAALLFDYRSWGNSEGQPRHLVAPRLHCQDYCAAVRQIKATGGLHGRVDPDRIILWGTSYSGGHSLAVASQLGNQISAVITMEPFTSPLIIFMSFFYLRFCPYSRGVPSQASKPDTSGITASSATGPRCPIETGTPATQCTQPDGLGRGPSSMSALLQPLMWEARQAVSSAIRGLCLMLVGVSDILRACLGLQAAHVPIVKPASAMAARMQLHWGLLRSPLCLGVLSDNEYQLMMTAVPQKKSLGWQNLCAARMLFFYPTYRPLKDAARLSCPVLMIAGRHDTLTPEHSIRKAATILGRQVGPEKIDVETLDGTHISLYHAPQLVPTMLRFLNARVPLYKRNP